MTLPAIASAATTLPPIARAALLLDIDGTLLEFAPTPEAVVVPPGLPETLQRLRAVFGDALGMVTGRPIAQVDALFGPIPYAVAGEHGAAIRRMPGAAVERPPLPELPAGWREAAAAAAAAHPGARLEAKARGFVLHYRLAPDAGPALHEAVLDLVAPHAAQFQVLEAAMAWEVRPIGIDKGVAVQTLMTQPPFAGRLPVFIGDDVTDEDGIRAATAMGGTGLLVGPVFGRPAGVRAWLAASGPAGWAALPTG